MGRVDPLRHPVFSSYRLRVVLLVSLGVVPMLALTLYAAAEQRKVAERHILGEAFSAAQLAAADHARLIEGARQLLTALAAAPEVRGDDPQACGRFLSSIRSQYDSYANLGAIRGDGSLWCSALPISRGINLADRAYFARTMASGGFSVGEYQIGRITGKPGVNFGYPIRDGTGALTGVVFAALDLDVFNRLAAPTTLLPGSTVTVLDPRGTVLVHYPRPERWVGKRLADAGIVRAILRERRGITRAQGFEGRARLFGFTTLGGGPSEAYAYVAIGIPAEPALAPVNRALARNVIGVLVIGALLLLAAKVSAERFILLPVDRLVAATRRMRGGDLTARSGIGPGFGELSHLAEGFDQMAGSLERFTGRLQEAEAKYRALVEQSLTGVYVIADDRFVYFNEAGAAVFGYAVDEVVGKKAPLDLVHPDDRDLVQRNIRARIEGAVQAIQYAFRGLRKDGSVVFCEVFGQRIEFEGRPAIMGTLIDVTDRRRAEVRLDRQLQRLNALRTIDMAITGSLDLRVSLNIILEQVGAQLQVDAADVLLLNMRTNELEFAAGRGFRSARIGRGAVRLGEGHAGTAALERRPVADPALSTAEGFVPKELVDTEGFVAYCVVPLSAKGQVLGVLEVFHRSPLEMDEEWRGFLEALAGQAAIAVDSALLFTDLQRANLDLVLAYDSTLEGWSRALDLRDKETEGHTLRVTEATLQLARAMSVDEPDLVHIRRGALLHDIGKMGIPDAILLKPGRFTDQEMAIMRRHPDYAYQLLLPISYLRRALDIPYCHHEKWDGTGYPRGLRGEQIPLAARIFAVVDVWDALRSDRPYRDGWPEERVREYIRSHAGSSFDPEVVRVFLSLEPLPREPVAFAPQGVR